MDVAGNGGLKTSHTVNTKEFSYRGSIDSKVEVVFKNSQPLRISRESIELITKEIESRGGPTLMGAIFSPLMPNSLGKAIQEKYRLSPITLSYVIPLLRERGLVKAFKNGRNWYVEAVKSR